ncbi:MAG: nucleotidyltransferase family protein [Planctomycetaceae bacterium]
MAIELKPFSWQRMIEAVEAVRERALRATAALRDAGIPYAVAGGNAVAAWVARVDRAATRNTQDVDILIRRSDFDRVKQALESAGFYHYEVMGVDCFIDGPDGSPRDAVHILYAGEKVRPEYTTASADVTEVAAGDDYNVVDLEALVRMKLNSFRRKDQVHLQDFLAVGLIDESWCAKLLPEHAARLQELIDDPDG